MTQTPAAPSIQNLEARGLGPILRWIVLCTAGELFGIAAAGLWFGGVHHFIGEPEPLPARLGAWLLLTLSAAPEALVLGGAQFAGLSPMVRGLSLGRWLLATFCVGLIGWGVGGFIPLFLAPQGPGGAGEPGAAATALFAGVFGAVAGVLFGAFQAMALPRAAGLRRGWIAANAAGWALGLPAIYLAAQHGADQTALAARLLWWAAGGAAAGACVGVATALALVRRAR